MEEQQSGPMPNTSPLFVLNLKIQYLDKDTFAVVRWLTFGRSSQHPIALWIPSNYKNNRYNFYSKNNCFFSGRQRYGVSDIRVVGGNLDRSNFKESSYVGSAARIFVHPNYVMSTGDNDIALIHVSRE